MQIKNYKIDTEGEQYIHGRITKAKRDIFISIILTIFLPILFVGLKTNFYRNVIEPPAIIAGISMFFFGGYGMIYSAVRRYIIMKLLIKEIQIDSDGLIKLYSFGGQKVSILMKDAKIYEGYKGNVKLKNIFDEITYRLENYKEGLTFYFVCSYWKEWDAIRERLEA